MYELVYLQAWTKSPPGGRYWVVGHGGALARPMGGHDDVVYVQGVHKRERCCREASSAS